MNEIDYKINAFRKKVVDAYGRILSRKENSGNISDYVLASEFDLEKTNGDKDAMRELVDEIGRDALEKFHLEFSSCSDGNSIFGWSLIDNLNDEEKEMMASRLEAFLLSKQIYRLLNTI